LPLWQACSSRSTTITGARMRMPITRTADDVLALSTLPATPLATAAPQAGKRQGGVVVPFFDSDTN
jgi:hypothetical protein